MSKDALQIIFARRSIRKYTSEPVGAADVQTLLEAAMAAPSASNRKPWHFVVVTERATLNKLADAHPYAKMLYEAPLCIAVCGDPAIAPQYWAQDCSAATENLLVGAAGLGLGTVWMGVYPPEERIAAVRRLLAIPETILPLNLIAVGHPAEHKEPRTQYDAARVHSERW